MRKRIGVFLLTAAVLLSALTPAASAAAGEYDATEGYGENTIYAVSTSHLDTCWSWTTEQTIEEFLPATFADNYALIDQYPEYEFNFEGAYRYALLEEYYPELYARLQGYVDAGNWNVAGSSWIAGDVNITSPEGLFRNVLYGNGWFAEHLGVRSKDIYLPDCFGFGYALPAIITQSNLLGFSTQKLSWGSSVGNTPNGLHFGRWVGVGGQTALAYFNLNGYTTNYANGVTGEQSLLDQLQRSGIGVSEGLFGSLGDRGGAVPEASIRAISREYRNNGNSDVKVKFAATDELFRDVDEAGLAEKLGAYDGELLMTAHGSGCYTSRANSKRYNRQNELLGVAAETVNVQSHWLGNTDYDPDFYEKVWTRVIAHQFHDDLTGTSNSKIYLRSWNDYILSLKQFRGAYESGTAGIAASLDTRVSLSKAQPLAVTNSLAFARREVVEADLTLPGAATNETYVRLYDAEGTEVPCQVLSGQVTGGVGRYRVLFLADLPSLGSRVYQAVPSARRATVTAGLQPVRTAADGSYCLENDRYSVRINANGDIESILDRSLDRELLDAPIRLSLQDMGYKYWAAWELNPEDYWNSLGDDYVTNTGDNTQITVTEEGTCRASVQITRTYGNSTYTQTVRLSAGGAFVTVDHLVDWQERGKLLKAELRTAASNPKATYDLGLGAVERGNNTPSLAEVPVQQWADLTHADGSFGVSLFNDGRTGMDKYSDNTLRLSLLYTPSNDYSHDTDSSSGHSSEYFSSGQYCQDQGENRFSYAIYGHAGPVGESDAARQAQAFATPMTVSQTQPHDGPLGSRFSFGGITAEGPVLLRALKGAEADPDTVIVRVNEMSGQAQSGVTLTLGRGIRSAQEVYASEEYRADAALRADALVFDLAAYEVKTFALTLRPPEGAGPDGPKKRP